MEQQDFYLYFNITYLLCSFFCFFYILRLTEGKNIPIKVDSILVISFSVFYALLFGFRGAEVGADTSQYMRVFTYINSKDFSYDNFKDYFFIFISKIVGEFTTNPSYMLLVVSSLYLFVFYKFLKNLPIMNKFIIFFTFSSMFFFKSMGINILRQGIAEMLFLLSLTYALINEKKKYVITSVLSVISHATMVIPVIVFLISKKYYNINPQKLIILFVLSIILSAANLDFNLILSNIPIINSNYKNYIAPSDYLLELYEIGFKPKFVLFNTFFFVLGLILTKYYKEFISPFYKRVFFTYTFLSCIFFLMFNIPYSDRVGLFSWCLIPLLVYPYFFIMKKKNPIWKWGIFAVCLILFLTFN